MYLRERPALEYVKSLPAWNGRDPGGDRRESGWYAVSGGGGVRPGCDLLSRTVAVGLLFRKESAGKDRGKLIG